MYDFVLLLFVYTYYTLKILEVAEGLEYIHSEGVVHGGLHGVYYLKHDMLRMLTLICRPISSWIPTYMFKSLALDRPD